MSFSECGYFLAKSAIPKSVTDIFSTYALLDEKLNPDHTNMDARGTHFKTSDVFTTSLLINMKPRIEELVGKKLQETSSHFRIYRGKTDLKNHHDKKDCCQVTASISMGDLYPDGYVGWPLAVEGENFYLSVGDMLLFRGADLVHGRPQVDLDKKYYQIQVFLHYIYMGEELSEEYNGIKGVSWNDLNNR